MKKIIGALAVAGLLAGCGSGSSGRADTVQDQPGGSAAPSVDAKSSLTLTAAQIKTRLLRVTDMPAGFTADRSKDDATTTPSGCKPLDALDTYPKTTKVDEQVKFTGGQFGPFVQEDVSIPRTSAKALYRQLVQAMQACPSFRSKNDDGSYSTVTVSGLSFPKFGDDAFAAQIRVAPVPMVGSAYADLVVVRLGTLFMLISDAQIAAAPDATSVEALVRTAVKRMQGA